MEISAIQADSLGRDDRSTRSLNKERVELTNTTRQSVNLDGWLLSDDSGHRYTFDHHRLAGRASGRIHTGVGCDTRTDLHQDCRTCGTTTATPPPRATSAGAAEVRQPLPELPALRGGHALRWDTCPSPPCGISTTIWPTTTT
ncbi:lamin tail domain-containing protein [Streptomyces sp. IBSBF 2806]|uniref:lamin tail domain-containing protein n=1 Tax=Streptomyces sp. IBSBF 2806 TaxID=2903529 RepID=UPI003FA6B154